MNIQSVDIDLWQMTGTVVFTDNSSLNIRGTCQCEAFMQIACDYMHEQYEKQTPTRKRLR